MALKFLGSAALFSVLPSRAHASRSTTGSRFLNMVNLHTGDRYQADYWLDGAYQQGALDKFNYVLRDHRDNLVAPIDTRVFDILHRLQLKLAKDGEFEILSGYRSPHTNAMLAARSNGVAKHSYHMKGMAVDIRMPGVKLASLRDAAKSLKAGGVGYYPASDFVHIDCGPVRYW
ncbi:MAG: DUF882 domain-containing protein [Shewanella sp.]|nr:DUF882 domain-containing protein [Shewanella sp.]MCF1431507.1 DUF882 domain-containing protein [Shewanella sp.]MCF1438671.1 DUF882 domain-containing protein [Shewanella sp.]MCF1456325.1 DUF882 domain-containing protein [Shewanella sp.]